MTRARIAAPTLVMIVMVTFGVLCAGRARAEEAVPTDPAARAAEVQKLNEEGMALYRARDYRHAVEKFLHAQALDQDPNLLFNIARCYEMLGERGAAIEKYEAFLSKPDADPQGKRRASEAIRAMRQARETTGAAGPAPPAPSAAVGAADRGEAERRPDTLPAAPAASSADSSFWNARLVTLGAGVLVTAAGAVAYALGVSDHNKVTGSAGYGMPAQIDPLTEAQARKLVDSGNTKKLVGEITMGAGGALLITSAILYAVHAVGGRVPETSTVSLRVAPSTTGGGLLLEGRF